MHQLVWLQAFIDISTTRPLAPTQLLSPWPIGIRRTITRTTDSRHPVADLGGFARATGPPDHAQHLLSWGRSGEGGVFHAGYVCAPTPDCSDSHLNSHSSGRCGEAPPVRRCWAFYVLRMMSSVHFRIDDVPCYTHESIVSYWVLLRLALKRCHSPPCPMAEFFALILRSYTHSPQLMTSISRVPLFVSMCLLLMLTVLHDTG